MDLKNYITKRKSTRSYLDTPVDNVTIKKIEDFILSIKPLYPHIKTKAVLVNKKDVKTIMPWFPTQAFALYSEEKDGMYENIGFMFQQLDLYFHSLGLGSFWIGLGKANNTVSEQIHGMKFVILLAFGYPKDSSFRTSSSDFKRKSLTEISNISDFYLEPARLAPSAINSQPWYFVTQNDVVHVYQIKRSALAPKMLKNLNRIDMGIALSHIYVSYPDSFKFFELNDFPCEKGKEYIGSFKK